MNDEQLNVFFRQTKKLVDIIEKDIKKQLTYTDINDLTLAEIGILDCINIDSEKTIKEIADSLGVALSTPTKTMDRLVKKGYINRKTSDADRRMVIARLTEKGTMALLKINEMRNNHIKLVMSILSNNEIDNLSSIINRLIKNI